MVLSILSLIRFIKKVTLQTISNSSYGHVWSRLICKLSIRISSGWDASYNSEPQTQVYERHPTPTSWSSLFGWDASYTSEPPTQVDEMDPTPQNLQLKLWDASYISEPPTHGYEMHPTPQNLQLEWMRCILHQHPNPAHVDEMHPTHQNLQLEWMR